MWLSASGKGTEDGGLPAGLTLQEWLYYETGALCHHVLACLVVLLEGSWEEQGAP